MRFETPWRAVLVAALMAAGLPAGVAAQSTFEGVITLSASNPEHTTIMTMWIKDQQVRTQLPSKGDRGMMYIVDRSGRFLTLMDSPRGRMYMVMPSRQAATIAAAATSDVKYVATGKSETVAGYPCTYYQILDPNRLRDKDNRYCITSALGFVGVGMGGRMSTASERAARQQFSDGYLVLKTTKLTGGKEVPQWEATKVERTAVSDTMFVLPAGYTQITRPGQGSRRKP